MSLHAFPACNTEATLNLFFSNIPSICTDFSIELDTFFLKDSTDILALCETYLNTYIATDESSMLSSILSKKDISNTYQRARCLYLRKSSICSGIPLLSPQMIIP